MNFSLSAAKTTLALAVLPVLSIWETLEGI